MSVEAAVARDLKQFGREARDSALAATALALAAELDDPSNSATSKSMCAKSMVDVLRELRAVAPPKREADDLDDLTARRKVRRAVAATAARS